MPLDLNRLRPLLFQCRHIHVYYICVCIYQRVSPLFRIVLHIVDLMMMVKVIETPPLLYDLIVYPHIPRKCVHELEMKKKVYYLLQIINIFVGTGDNLTFIFMPHPHNGITCV